MSAMTSQLASLTIVYSSIYSRRRSKKTPKHRVTGLCAENSQWPVNSPHKEPLTRKMFLFDDVIMWRCIMICPTLCAFLRKVINSIKSFIICTDLLAADASAHLVISQNNFFDLEIVKTQKAYPTLRCFILSYDEDIGRNIGSSSF